MVETVTIPRYGFNSSKATTVEELMVVYVNRGCEGLCSCQRNQRAIMAEGCGYFSTHCARQLSGSYTEV